jgi:hypothetical protein
MAFTHVTWRWAAASGGLSVTRFSFRKLRARRHCTAGFSEAAAWLDA